MTDAVKKLFVLDTNVLMQDPSSFFNFEEHDVFIPFMVLEELDRNKKGNSDVARNARQVSRKFKEILANADTKKLEEGLPLFSFSNNENGASKKAKGKIFFEVVSRSQAESRLMPDGDNNILSVVGALKNEHPDVKVILVSNDINMWIKARALCFHVEDYKTDQAVQDIDILPTGMVIADRLFWETHEFRDSGKKDGLAYYRVKRAATDSFVPNQLLCFPSGSEHEELLLGSVGEEGDMILLSEIRNHRIEKGKVWNVTSRSRAQNFALHLLLDPLVDLVTILGQAGTGKTLLALASGLNQVFDKKIYDEIIMTRAPIPLGEDMGFLPGTEEEKMTPWMGALEDNLDVLLPEEGERWKKSATRDFIRQRIKIKSMNFMRGRSFVNKFLIVDEAQNLTHKQMKTLLTRAGPGTKVVCLGNLAQIDTPYLSEVNSGLTHVVERFGRSGSTRYGHVTLEKVERSELAELATELL